VIAKFGYTKKKATPTCKILDFFPSIIFFCKLQKYFAIGESCSSVWIQNVRVAIGANRIVLQPDGIANTVKEFSGLFLHKLKKTDG
jgi:hypothetical protein